jgi:hypothetical protein
MKPMFCNQCGTSLADTATLCLACNAPIARAGASPTPARATSQAALAALKTLVVDPIGGLVRAHAQLDAYKALRVGLAFGILSLACFLLGGYRLLPEFLRGDLFEFLGFGGVMKCLLFGSVPFVSFACGGTLARKLSGAQGTLASDAYIAGAALLPLAACSVIAGFAGLENYEVIGIAVVFAGCLCTLMLFTGFTRITKLGERAGALSVPIVILLTVWLAKLLATSVLEGQQPSYGRDDFPF